MSLPPQLEPYVNKLDAFIAKYPNMTQYGELAARDEATNEKISARILDGRGSLASLGHLGDDPRDSVLLLCSSGSGMEHMRQKICRKGLSDLSLTVIVFV